MLKNSSFKLFFKFRIIFVCSVLVVMVSYANIVKADIIRDSEIEEVLHLITEPLLKNAKRQDVKIYLINDDTLNAFTDGKNIYLYVGLLRQFPNIDVIRGVVAHELGHIAGRHVPRQMQNMDIARNTIISSVALGMFGALSGNPLLAQAITTGGFHVAERTMLSYSRHFEASADQYALKLLEGSNKSVIGMIEFFEYMQALRSSKFINPYEQTHPLSSDRLSYLRNFYQTSKYKESNESQILRNRFTRIIAKLQSFTTKNPQSLLNNLPVHWSSEVQEYAKAILHFRSSELNNALRYIDQLIQLKPLDPFYLELKGQILFEFGSKDALAYYEKATKIRPNDSLMLLSKAIVGLSVYKSQPKKLDPFYKDLKMIIAKEHDDNLVALYYLVVYYDIIGNKGMNFLTSAIIAVKSGDLERAKKLANAAIKLLPSNSPDWYKAQDIITIEKR